MKDYIDYIIEESINKILLTEMVWMQQNSQINMAKFWMC